MIQPMSLPMSMSKDLWSIANSQVSKMKVQRPLVVQNQNFSSTKSMDQIFRKAGNTLAKVMPSGQNIIKTTKQQVPLSVKLLDKYAQKIGFLPMGPIYQGSGAKYIGRVSDKTQKGQVFFKQFPNLGQQFIDSPDVTQNLTFKANKAIVKWNQFVTAQSDLGNFLQQVQTQDGQKKMMSQYAKTSSLGSDYLRMLSSMYYYYFDSKSPSSNILQVGNPMQLKQVLSVEGKIVQRFKIVIDYIQRNSKRNQYVSYIRTYHQYKLQSLKGTLAQSQYIQLEKLMKSQIAVVPDQMISLPINTRSSWLSTINKEQSVWKTKIIIENWNPKYQWFRPINYLKF